MEIFSPAIFCPRGAFAPKLKRKKCSHPGFSAKRKILLSEKELAESLLPELFLASTLLWRMPAGAGAKRQS